MPGTTASADLARAVERLRLAEAALARRRQTDCGPSETARAVMRLLYDRADAGAKVTPTAIAASLGVSTPTVTAILRSLHDGGLVVFARNPDDGRSKYVAPVDRSADVDGVDPLTARIRDRAETLDPDLRARLAEIVEDITTLVDAECR